MSVIPREPPVRPGHPLDGPILAQLDEPTRPVDVAAALDIDAHTVAVRLRALMEAGRVRRIKPVEGPRNGPGSALYVRLPG